MMTLRRRAAQGVRVMSAMSAVVLFGALHTGCGAEDLEAFEEAPEPDSTAGWRNVYLGETYGVRQMWVERVGDSLIADGDILLRTPSDALGDTASPAQSTQGVTGEKLLEGTLFDGGAYRWPLVDNAIHVRYCVDAAIAGRVPSAPSTTSGDFPTTTEIEAAMQVWSHALESVGRKIEFENLNPNTPDGSSHGRPQDCPESEAEDVLAIGAVNDKSGTCAALVGKGKSNRLTCDTSLDFTLPQAWRQFVIVHELGHVLGLLHEQCRVDRDSFVTVEPPLPPNLANYGVQDEDGRRGASIDLGIFNHESVMLYPSSAIGIATQNGDPLPYTFTYRWRNGTAVPFNYTISMGDINAVAQLYWGASRVDDKEGVRVAQGIGHKAPTFVTTPPSSHPAVEFSPGSKVWIAPPRGNEWGGVLDLSRRAAGLAAVVLRKAGTLEITEYSDGGFWPAVLKKTELTGSFPDQPLVTAPTPATSVGADLVVVRRDAKKLVTDVDVLPVRRAFQQAWTVSKPVRVALAASGLPPVQHVFSGDLTGDGLPELGLVSLAAGEQKGAIYVAVNQGGAQAAFAEPAKWAIDVSASEDDGSSVKFAVMDGVAIAIRMGSGSGRAEVAWWTVPFAGALQYSGRWVALRLDGSDDLGFRGFSFADFDGDEKSDLAIFTALGVRVALGRGGKDGLPFEPNLQFGSEWVTLEGLHVLCPKEPCHYGFAAIPGTTAGTDLFAFTRP